MPENQPKIIAFPGAPPGSLAKPPSRIGIEDLILVRAGVTVLDGLSLELRAEGISALMGPNGAGKSVLLRVIAGLLPANSGRISLPAPMQGRVGLVFQRPVLLRRSVRGNLAHALRLTRLDRAIRRERLAELLRISDLEDLADRPARRLSGGQAQRLAIVRALAANPALLLVDEPTAHLDPASVLAVEGLLARVALAGTKVVMVSHDRGQVGRLSSEVAFLHRGRCCETTDTDTFLALPQSPEARAYLDGSILL